AVARSWRLRTRASRSPTRRRATWVCRAAQRRSRIRWPVRIEKSEIGMNRAVDAEALLKAGDPTGALAALQNEVRSKAADAKLRVFLFQLLCVQGQWERALNQLKVCAELDPAALPMR